MQRALWLIRHAQAQNVQGIRQTDAQRQLTSQGLANVEQLQAHLQNHSDPPAQWLWVSPATRTQQTAQPLAAVWQAEVISEPTLYLARADTILDCLKGAPDHCERHFREHRREGPRGHRSKTRRASPSSSTTPSPTSRPSRKGLNTSRRPTRPS